MANLRACSYFLFIQWPHADKIILDETVDTLSLEYGLAFAFLLGAIAGSFLNVCIYRLPRHLSVVYPGSHCTHCHAPIRWHDNIPVVSYLLLKGRCRTCGGRIPPMYPFVEALTGLLFVLSYSHFDLSLALVASLFLACGLIVASCIDLRYGLIPNPLNAFLFITGIAQSFIHGFSGFYQSLWGAAVGGGFLYLTGVIGKWILSRESMGNGDIKLVAGIGLFLGWEATLDAIVVACALGTCVGLLLRALGRHQPYAPIPFAPFLSLGAVIELFIEPIFL